MDFFDSSCQDCPDTSRSTGEYIIFYQGGTIYHSTHLPELVSQSSAEIQYNAKCTAGLNLSHFRRLIHELLNKDHGTVPEKSPLIILDIKASVCMANNGKYTKHTRHISRIVHLIRNGGNSKMHKIDWCDGGLQLADTATKHFGENDLTPRMKYIMEILDNLDITLVQEM